MWYVYVIKSIEKDYTYIGSTKDLERRLREHNAGESLSTKHYRPFELIFYLAVPTEKKAREIEQYFKTGSGAAILKKRFLSGNL
jgi:putative endonuclease